LTQSTPVKANDDDDDDDDANPNPTPRRCRVSATASSDGAVSIDNAGDWTVTLLVDKREKDRDLITATLRGLGVNCDVHTLALGDFLWVARRKSSDSSEECECVVLECIAERKTPSDLASSILDGRYREQKLRLTRCGLRTKLYILEGLSLVMSKYNPSSHMSAASLKSAMITSQVEHNLQVIRTRGIDHTISFLSKMHRVVTKNFINTNANTNSNTNSSRQSKEEVRGYTRLDVFHDENGKKKVKVVGDLFAYQLKQIPGCSAASAKAVQMRFGTIRNMIEECQRRSSSSVIHEVSLLEKCYSNSSSNSKEVMGRVMGRVKGGHIGPKLAEKVYKMFAF